MITQAEFNELERRGIFYFKKLAPKLDDNDYWTILRALLWIDKGMCNDKWAELFFNSGRGKTQKIIMKSRGAGHSGLCSGERSMISPDYARNFICDFILGKTQQLQQQKLF